MSSLLILMQLLLTIFVDRNENISSARSMSTYDISEEYSLQMNSTALLGLQPCSYRQCKRIGVVGAG